MNAIAKALFNSASTDAKKVLFSPKEFLHLASRDAIDQTLARLTRQNKILRLSRGTYALPIKGQFGPYPPSVESIIENLKMISGEIVAISGASAANILRLTTQMPVQEIFWTSGRSRQLYLGNRKVQFKHVGHQYLLMGNRPAGMAIRALRWLGEKEAPNALKILYHKLEPEEWKAIYDARSNLPSWLALAISEFSVD